MLLESLFTKCIIGENFQYVQKKKKNKKIKKISQKEDLTRNVGAATCEVHINIL